MNENPQWQPLGDGRADLLLADQAPAVRTRDGRFLRLNESPPADGARRDDYVDRLGRVLAQREQAAAVRRWPGGRRMVTVVGADQLGLDLVDRLQRSGADVRHIETWPAEPESDLSASDAVVVPDGAAAPRSLLEGLSRRGTTVLTGHREHDQYLLMPLMMDGSEATPDQVRRRRLAASPAARELALWLSRADHPSEPLDALARGFVTARMLGVLTDWAGGSPAVEEHRLVLRVLDVDVFTETAHTVLGFDEPAAR